MPPPKTTDELVSVAVAARPDVSVFRLNVCRRGRREAGQGESVPGCLRAVSALHVSRQCSVQFAELALLGLGATVTAPIYDRNQGNIRRAGVNVEQSRLELQAYERHVVSEVEDAQEEYEVSRAMIERIEKHLLPAARHVAITA